MYKIIKGNTKNIAKIEKDVEEYISELEKKRSTDYMHLDIKPYVFQSSIYIFIHSEYHNYSEWF